MVKQRLKGPSTCVARSPQCVRLATVAAQPSGPTPIRALGNQYILRDAFQNVYMKDIAGGREPGSLRSVSRVLRILRIAVS